MNRVEEDLANPQPKAKAKTRGRPKLYIPPETPLIADDYEEPKEEPKPAAKAKGRPNKNTTAESKHTRSRSKTRTDAELEEEKRVAQEQAALLQEMQEKAKEQPDKAAAKANAKTNRLVKPLPPKEDPSASSHEKRNI